MLKILGDYDHVISSRWLFLPYIYPRFDGKSIREKFKTLCKFLVLLKGMFAAILIGKGVRITILYNAPRDEQTGTSEVLV